LKVIFFSGTFSRRGTEGLIAHSGLICADLDDLGDELSSLKQTILTDPHTLACFVSPSGNGLKVVLRCDPKRYHKESFAAVERYFLEKFEVQIDTACSDVSRPCFVSHDPEAYIAQDAKEIPYPPAPEPFKEPTEVQPRPCLTGGLRPGDDYNIRGDVFCLLEANRWTALSEGQWRRPDKPRGVSAIWNEDTRTFWVFSSNAAPLEPERLYRPWHLYALFEHNGDFKSAAKALAAMGYGKQPHSGAQADPKLNKMPLPRGGPDKTVPVPLPLWPPSRFLTQPDDPGAYLLGDGYIERGEWTSLVGIGGLGKTRLALWLSICLISGRDWLGLKCGPKPPRVLFLSSENGIRRWKMDLSKMTAALTQEERATVETNLLILALTPEAECDLHPTDAGSKSRMIAALQEAKPDLVILDPLADMIQGDESKAADMVATLRDLREVQRRGHPEAALLIIHHSRSGADNVAIAGDRYNAGAFGRGSKAFYSRVRCELQLAPGDKDDGNMLVLACGKANNTAPFKARGIVFHPETFTYSVDRSFDLEAWRSNVHGKRKETAVSIADVVNAVRELAPEDGAHTTRKEVCRLLEGNGASTRTVQDRIKAAIKANYLNEGKKRSDIGLGRNPLSK
jgi:hypothetical protein